MPSMKSIRRLIDAADKQALILLEHRARKILKDHPNLEEFVIGMGTAFFTMGPENLRPDERAYMKPVQDILDEFDDALRITGASMRFTATGPIR